MDGNSIYTDRLCYGRMVESQESSYWASLRGNKEVLNEDSLSLSKSFLNEFVNDIASTILTPILISCP